MIRYTIEKHSYGFPSKVASGSGSPHIYNIRLTKDHDNGSLVGKGKWVAFDEYEETTVPAFKGVVRDQAANGNWYVEVTEATDALFVFDSAIIAESYNSDFTSEKNFFNESGKTVKAYSLIVGDIVEISEEGFSGTVAKDKEVTYESDKYKIGE